MRSSAHAIRAADRYHFEAEIECLRDSRGSLEVGCRVDIRVDEGSCHRCAPGPHDGKREVVDRAQEQFAEHIERLLPENSIERAIDVLLVDDFAGLTRLCSSCGETSSATTSSAACKKR